MAERVDIVKRSVRIAGHATSVSLEPAFWDALCEIAARREMSLNALLSRIDAAGGGKPRRLRPHQGGTQDRRTRAPPDRPRTRRQAPRLTSFSSATRTRPGRPVPGLGEIGQRNKTKAFRAR